MDQAARQALGDGHSSGQEGKIPPLKEFTSRGHDGPQARKQRNKQKNLSYWKVMTEIKHKDVIASR